MIQNLIFGVYLKMSDFPAESIKANKNWQKIISDVLRCAFFIAVILSEVHEISRIFSCFLIISWYDFIIFGFIIIPAIKFTHRVYIQSKKYRIKRFVI